MYPGPPPSEFYQFLSPASRSNEHTDLLAKTLVQKAESITAAKAEVHTFANTHTHTYTHTHTHTHTHTRARAHTRT